MAKITSIHREQDVPSMTVFELAVASAIGRQKPRDDTHLCDMLSDWFQKSVSASDVTWALSRMEELGWVRSAGIELSDYQLTPDGIDSVPTLYGGCIRMIDRGLGVLKVSYLLSLLDLPKEQNNG